jgi:excisionase family DNA binding protein
MTDSYPQILKTEQVAEILGWDVRKVRREARAGRLPAYRLPGERTFRFFRDEIVEWPKSQSSGGSDTQTDR